MKILRVLLKKEFLQISRSKFILIIMFVMPVVQLLVLPLAATYEMKNISLSVVDNDHSTYAQQLINKFTASGYFKLNDYSHSFGKALTQVEKNNSDIILEIPPGFEKTLIKENKATVALNVNAISGSTAGLAASYAATIIRDYNTEIREKLLHTSVANLSPAINITYSNWFNPDLNYRKFMVPGILVMLLSLVGGFLAALNIVSEKEKGTIEQINVTPVKKTTFIISKIIPFWIIGMIIFSIGLLLCRLVYHIIPVGSYGTLYAFAAVYMLAFLGFGLLISTYSDNQQQAMFIAFFFMIIFILLSGEFTPITSMPEWAQIISKLNPLSYFVEVMRLVMLKGSSFRDVLTLFLSICGFGVVLNGWAILNYRKTS
ncbi:MAG: ABC transporter permease [Ginsengibacter sp.]